MEPNRFDELARVLAGSASRRTVIRAMTAGLAAAVGLRASRVGAGQVKKPLCHATGSATNPWEVIEVAEPAWQTNYAHGDHDFVDCCDNTYCTAPQTCGGGGQEGECGCTPTLTSAHCNGVTCGEVPDGCGGTVTCGCANPHDTCGGGGVAGQCGCTDDGTACGTAVCGTATNSCGDTVTCGSPNGGCPSGHECNGGQCVCTPDCAGAACGDPDGCGGTCGGSCPPTQTCLPEGCGCASPRVMLANGSCGYPCTTTTGQCDTLCGGLCFTFNEGSFCGHVPATGTCPSVNSAECPPGSGCTVTTCRSLC